MQLPMDHFCISAVSGLKYLREGAPGNDMFEPNTVLAGTRIEEVRATRPTHGNPAKRATSLRHANQESTARHLRIEAGDGTGITEPKRILGGPLIIE